MKIQTIKTRILNAESKLQKLNGTIDRHMKQLEKKSKVLTDKGIDLNNYDKKAVNNATWSELYDYERKLEDIKSNEKKIAEVTKTLQNLNEQLEKQLAVENEKNNIIPEVLNQFLADWKKQCFEYYTNLANKFLELKFKEYEITREELEKLKVKEYNKENFNYDYVRKFSDEEIEKILNISYPSQILSNLKEEIKYKYITKFKSNHFVSDIYVIEKIIDYNIIDNDILNKILDEDVEIKKEMFVSRIKEVIGEIKDLSNLEVGDNGDLNGIAIGVKCNAMVKTISAGGHNIQCHHFRVLVNAIK